MNTSAKMTAVSFLAAVALGAAAFMGGCTVTSDTNPDTDGGTINNPDGGGSSNPDGSTTAPKCESKQDTSKGELGGPDCQKCAEAQCCDKIKTCFDIEAAETETNCQDYVDCASKCVTENPTDEDARAKCFQDDCDVAPAAGVKAAYEAIFDCLVGADGKGGACQTECNQ